MIRFAFTCNYKPKNLNHNSLHCDNVMILFIFIVLVSLASKQPDIETTISRKEPKESEFKALKQQVRDS